MRNKKNWLIIKGILLLLVAVVIVMLPSANTTRTWIRFLMLIFFTFSFIIDLTKYKKNNA